MILSVTNIIKIPDSTVSIIINSVLSVLALLGVITPPSDNDKEQIANISQIEKEIQEINTNIINEKNEHKET